MKYNVLFLNIFETSPFTYGYNIFSPVTFTSPFDVKIGNKEKNKTKQNTESNFKARHLVNHFIYQEMDFAVITERGLLLCSWNLN